MWGWRADSCGERGPLAPELDHLQRAHYGGGVEDEGKQATNALTADCDWPYLRTGSGSLQGLSALASQMPPPSPSSLLGPTYLLPRAIDPTRVPGAGCRAAPSWVSAVMPRLVLAAPSSHDGPPGRMQGVVWGPRILDVTMCWEGVERGCGTQTNPRPHLRLPKRRPHVGSHDSSRPSTRQIAAPAWPGSPLSRGLQRWRADGMKSIPRAASDGTWTQAEQVACRFQDPSSPQT